MGKISRLRLLHREETDSSRPGGVNSAELAALLGHGGEQPKRDGQGGVAGSPGKPAPKKKR